jgi:hypothetical protein
MHQLLRGGQVKLQSSHQRLQLEELLSEESLTRLANQILTHGSCLLQTTTNQVTVTLPGRDLLFGEHN